METQRNIHNHYIDKMSFDDNFGKTPQQRGYGSTSSRMPQTGGGGSSVSTARGYQARDGDNEYVRVSQQISSNTFAINTNVNNLGKLILNFGHPTNDTKQVRDKFHQLSDSTNSLVRESSLLMKQLAMNQIDGGTPSEERSRRMQKEKLGKEFQDVVGKFKSIQTKALSIDQVSLKTQREAKTASFVQDEGPSQYNESDKQRLLDERNLSQLESQVEHSSSLIREREMGIQEIQEAMSEVNDIMRDLSQLVHDQGSQLDNIESNIDSVDHNVEAGKGQLVKADEYQKKARNKMCCLLVIVLIVAGVITAIVISANKK